MGFVLQHNTFLMPQYDQSNGTLWNVYREHIQNARGQIKGAVSLIEKGGI
jgi:hypothetical protein